MVSRISGIGIIGIEKKIKELHAKFQKKTIYTLPIGGLYRYRKSGENHQYQGKLIHLLQTAVSSGSYEQYKKYSAGIHNLPPINIRDLFMAFQNFGQEFIKDKHIKGVGTADIQLKSSWNPGFDFDPNKLELNWVKNIDIIEKDTFKDVNNFYSYRRSQKLKEADYGRCISTICLKT